MELDALIDILLYTKSKLGGQVPVCFSSGCGGSYRVFDFGEEGRDSYMLTVSIKETTAHVDGFGRFHLPIREVPEERRPLRAVETAEDAEWFEQQKVYLTQLFTHPSTVKLRKPVTVWPPFDNEDVKTT